MILQNMGTKTIETERLLLRRFVIEDAQPMFNNWANDMDVCKFLAWNPHGNIEVTQEILSGWIAAYENDHVYNWAIEYKEIGQVIGSISAVHFSAKHQSCEIGYCIGKPFWSKGITSEALKAIMHYFFTEVGVNRIQAQHDILNAASGKVMKHAGMVLEGTLRQNRIRRDGTFADGNVWAMIREDYND